jgi:2-aminoethylphosphonate-pyruvate transaminase
MGNSGTYGLESVISSAIPAGARVLVLSNGAYGDRLAAICRVHGLNTGVLAGAPNAPLDPNRPDAMLHDQMGFTHVLMVHCETSTGVINPMETLAKRAHERGLAVVVDAMSSFGAAALSLAPGYIDCIITSSNKCIEGVPGFAIVLAKKEFITHSQGQARTLALDLYAQWKGLESNGQFRFTPPTHALAAFARALQELSDEGGVTARELRYRRNCEVLLEGMRQLGFETYLPASVQGYIINSFLYPTLNFDFDEFYHKLNGRGFVIYPGKLTEADCFRIGNIGRLHEDDMRELVEAIGQVMQELGAERGQTG